MRIEITGARLIDPATGTDAENDLFLADGRVVAIGRRPDGFTAERRIDARGQWAIPGLVELSARLREPGLEFKADITSESRAAVGAGITTLCVPPDTDPVIDTPAVVDLIVRRARELSLARIEVIGALTAGLGGERLAEMHALKMAGCVAMSNADHTIANAEMMRRAMEYAATFGLTVMTWCEDGSLARGRHAHGGSAGFALGLDPIPPTAETIMVSRDLLLAEQTGAHVHFCRLSTARAVAMIGEARTRGLPVSADVAAHQLFLTDAALNDFDTACHVRPPLRSGSDRSALRDALRDGVLTAMTSDHQPHEADAKMNPFTETESGVSGLDTLLGLTLRWAEEDDVPLTTALAAVTSGPAAVAGLDRGSVAPGCRADVCLVDPEVRWTVSPDTIRSRGKNTPFTGYELQGRVTTTIVGGNVVHEA
ncbi:MAG: dihydroorotase [Pseudomonadota bacterium]